MTRYEFFRAVLMVIVIGYAVLLVGARKFEPTLPSWKLLVSFLPTLLCMAVAASLDAELERRIGFFAIGLMIVPLGPTIAICIHDRNKRRARRKALRALTGK